MSHIPATNVVKKLKGRELLAHAKRQSQHVTQVSSYVVYSRGLLTRSISLPITFIGKNITEVMEEYIRDTFEGKCTVEGYVKPRSVKLINHSCGDIKGADVVFEVVFECDICFPVKGMLLRCTAMELTKAGIRCESADEIPSPIIVYLAKDHHHDNNQFSNIQEGEKVVVRVIGQRFQLNDPQVSIIAELVRDPGAAVGAKPGAKPKITIK